MRDIQIWIGISLGILMISTVLFAFIARKPLCIDSKLVEKIDSISASGTASAYRCGLHKHVDYDEKLSLEIRDLNRRLQALEKYLEWLGPLQNRVNITVIADTDSFYRIQDHQIFIGDGFLNKKGHIEKSLLKIWLSERVHESVLSQPLLIESLTDLMYFSLAGEFDIQDVQSGLVLGADLQARWPRVLNNTTAYCHSPWRLNEDIARCDQQQSPDIADAHSAQTEILSLRPLITQSFIASYQRMNSMERVGWMLDFSQKIGTMNFNHAEGSPEEYLKSILKLFEGSNKFSAILESEFKQRGFNQFDQNRYDYLVFADDINASWIKQLQKANQKDLIAIEYKGSQISNEESLIEIQNSATLTAETGIMVRCGDIDFNQVKAVSKRVQRLLYIKACEEDSIELSGYFESGAKGLASKNKNLQFIEFHTPSLRLALRRTPSLENVSIIQSQNIQSRLFDYLGWQKPEFDILSKAYKAKSAIEAVDWYRL